MAKNRMGLRVHIERCRTAIALIASTVVLSGFSNRDLQAYHAPRDTYLECVQRMNLVRHLRNDRGVFDFERNFAESPSITFYHWEDYPTVTREVERNGFAESDLHGILRQWAGSGIGLFLSSDPQSSSAHGEIMMAVDVYAPSYPGSAAAVEDTNHPHWLPTDGAMIRDNVFDYYLKKPAHPLESQIAYPGWWYVQDLRVIKQLRWPSKNMVDSLWLRRPLSSAMLRNRYQRHHIKAGAQWMIAPNYSTEERWVRWVSTAAVSSLYINFVLLNPIPMSLSQSHESPIAYRAILNRRLLETIFAGAASANYVDDVNGRLDSTEIDNAWDQTKHQPTTRTRRDFFLGILDSRTELFQVLSALP